MKPIRIVGAMIAVSIAAAACNNSSSTVSSAGNDTGGPTSAPGPTLPPITATTPPATGPSPVPASLPDGRHFVFAMSVKTKAGVQQMRFDLAYFLTGDAATQAAKDHGDEFPPPNDYYIVNDNSKLRWLPVSETVKVMYIPETHCCDLVKGDFSAWADTVNGTVQSDYSGVNVPWWITVKGGQIVKIEQQYLP